MDSMNQQAGQDTRPAMGGMNAQGPSPMQPEAPKPPHHSGVGPVVGIIIIIILLAAGGLYFYMSEQEKVMENDAAQMEIQKESADAQAEALRTTSSSDTTASLESDLNATDLGSSESDLQAAESAL